LVVILAQTVSPALQQQQYHSYYLERQNVR